MPEALGLNGITLGEERKPMLECALLLAFCIFMVLISLGTAAWVAVTAAAAQGPTTDDLFLIGIALTLAAFFGFNVAWSVRTGEFREVLNDLRKRSSKGGGSGESSDKTAT